MPTRLVAVLLVTGFILVGCQTVDSDDASPAKNDDLTLDAQANPPALEPGPEKDPAPDAPTIEFRRCDDAVRNAIDATIAAQTQAFLDENFDAAYALASPSFQAGIPLDTFVRLIRVNYPQLLTAANARSGSCEADVDNGIATIVVQFDTPSDPSYTLRYVVELVQGQWRISGANQETVVDTVV